MPKATGVRFDGESRDYRLARQKLLKAELDLRREVEKVAALRRQLPDGHVVPLDYEFDEMNTESRKPQKIRLSGLFALPRKSLVIYNFMYAEDGKPCPMCSAFLDSFNGVALHAQSQLNVAIVAKGPIKHVAAWAEKRAWSNLRMLSSASNSFNTDYLAESASGTQLPLISVFKKRKGVIHHFYTNEMFFAPNEPKQNPRHADMMFPLWNVFDLTPEGRPSKWFPKL